jgi:hypothetical protein
MVCVKQKQKVVRVVWMMVTEMRSIRCKPKCAVNIPSPFRPKYDDEDKLAASGRRRLFLYIVARAIRRKRVRVGTF